jgi:hypothetical protein
MVMSYTNKPGELMYPKGSPGFDKKLSGSYTSEFLVPGWVHEFCNQLYYKSNSAHGGYAKED